MDTVCAYYRVSTMDQGLANTVDAQKFKVRDYANSRGWTIEKEFYDVGSGADGDRPEFNALKRWIVKNEGKKCLAARLDRLSRDPADWHELSKLCIRHDVELLPLDAISTGDATSDELLKDLIISFAKYERKVIRDRLYSGRMRKLRQGIQIVGKMVPYGYYYDQNEEVHKVKVDYEQAEVVKKIFDRWVEFGDSLNAICRYLRSRGVLTQKGRKYWATSTVKGLLKNEAYIGKMYYNKRRHKTKHAPAAKRPRSEWIEVPIEPLIDNDTWKAAQVRFNDPIYQPKSGPPKYKYLLNGLVYCGNCGKRYDAFKSGNGIKYYRCSSRRPDRNPYCRNRVQNVDKLDEAIWPRVAAILSSPDRLEEHFRESRETTYKEIKRLRSSLQSDIKRVGEYEARKKELVNQLAEGKNIDVVVAAVNKITEKLREIASELEEKEKVLEGLDKSLRENITKFRVDHTLQFKNRGKLSFNKQQDLCRKMIDKILILPKGKRGQWVRVYWKFSDSPMSLDLKSKKLYQTRSNSDYSSFSTTLLRVEDIDITKAFLTYSAPSHTLQSFHRRVNMTHHV